MIMIRYMILFVLFKIWDIFFAPIPYDQQGINLNFWQEYLKLYPMKRSIAIVMINDRFLDAYISTEFLCKACLVWQMYLKRVPYTCCTAIPRNAYRAGTASQVNELWLCAFFYMYNYIIRLASEQRYQSPRIMKFPFSFNANYINL